MKQTLAVGLPKLVAIGGNQIPANYVEMTMLVTQKMVLLHNLFGTLYEVERMLMKGPSGRLINKVYLAHLSEPVRLAYDEIKRSYGSGFLSRIRNEYSFHLPSNVAVEQAFQDTPADDDWSLYVSDSINNSVWHACEMVIGHGAVLQIDPTDRAAAFAKLVDHAVALSNSMGTFLINLQRAMFEIHFPEALRPIKVLEIENAPHMDEFVLPFFFEPPRRRGSNGITVPSS